MLVIVSGNYFASTEAGAPGVFPAGAPDGVSVGSSDSVSADVLDFWYSGSCDAGAPGLQTNHFR